MIGDMVGIVPLNVPFVYQTEKVVEKMWYEGEIAPDELYDSDDYLICTLGCYIRVTGPTCRAIANWWKLPQINWTPRTIVDVWAGIGLGTAHLAMEFPESTVVYHNTQGKQWLVAEAMFEELDLVNVVMVDDPEVSIKADTVVAFEVMEHFPNPISEISKFLGPLTRMYVDCSSFAYDSAGHMKQFQAPDGSWIDHKLFRRTFNTWLRDNGWEDACKHFKVPNFWQCRPQPWIRTGVVRNELDIPGGTAVQRRSIARGTHRHIKKENS